MWLISQFWLFLLGLSDRNLKSQVTKSELHDKLTILTKTCCIVASSQNCKKKSLLRDIISNSDKKKSLSLYFTILRKKVRCWQLRWRKSELRKIDNYHVLFLFSGENMPFIHMTFFFFLRKSRKILLNTIPPVIDWLNILIHN